MICIYPNALEGAIGYRRQRAATKSRRQHIFENLTLSKVVNEITTNKGRALNAGATLRAIPDRPCAKADVALFSQELSGV